MTALDLSPEQVASVEHKMLYDKSAVQADSDSFLLLGQAHRSDLSLSAKRVVALMRGTAFLSSANDDLSQQSQISLLPGSISSDSLIKVLVLLPWGLIFQN